MIRTQVPISPAIPSNSTNAARHIGPLVLNIIQGTALDLLLVLNVDIRSAAIRHRSPPKERSSSVPISQREIAYGIGEPQTDIQPVYARDPTSIPSDIYSLRFPGTWPPRYVVIPAFPPLYYSGHHHHHRIPSSKLLRNREKR